MTISQREWTERQRALDLRNLPIPNEYRGKTFADIRRDRNVAAFAEVERWVAEAPTSYLRPSHPEAGLGLLLFGEPGTGKTLTASVVAQEMVRRAKKRGLVHFISMEGFNRHRLRKMELSRILENTDADLWEDYLGHDEAIQKCYSVRLLVLDDVGQENTTDHLARMLNELLRTRYAEGKPTIITTNLDPHEWADQFGNASLGSFVFQACKVIPIVGEDARAAR